MLKDHLLNCVQNVVIRVNILLLRSSKELILFNLLLMDAFIYKSITYFIFITYEGVSKSFRTGRLEPELQMV